MKKTTAKKALALSRETIRSLDLRVERVVGAQPKFESVRGFTCERECASDRPCATLVCTQDCTYDNCYTTGTLMCTVW
ncbi:MAG TPA: hypothetical protein VL463_02285 [Kofleriaceae bacterium]|nr:hypothetical protein [Kofleriaceae bacterium]